MAHASFAVFVPESDQLRIEYFSVGFHISLPHSPLLVPLSPFPPLSSSATSSVCCCLFHTYYCLSPSLRHSPLFPHSLVLSALTIAMERKRERIFCIRSSPLISTLLLSSPLLPRSSYNQRSLFMPFILPNSIWHQNTSRYRRKERR